MASFARNQGSSGGRAGATALQVPRHGEGHTVGEGSAHPFRYTVSNTLRCPAPLWQHVQGQGSRLPQGTKQPQLGPFAGAVQQTHVVPLQRPILGHRPQNEKPFYAPYVLTTAPTLQSQPTHAAQHSTGQWAPPANASACAYGPPALCLLHIPAATCERQTSSPTWSAHPSPWGTWASRLAKSRAIRCARHTTPTQFGARRRS